MPVITMSELELANQRVLIRQDLNVPINAGKVSSDQRILASLPTIKAAQQAGAKVLLMSHLGRPTEGEFDQQFSLQPVADRLTELLGSPVRLIRDYLLEAPSVQSGEVVLLENVRFNIGEKKDEPTLAKLYASLCDVYVMDAFGTAHRAQASTHGVGLHAPIACAGPLLSAELNALAAALDNPKRPLVAIVGGSKVSTKLTVLNALSKVVDQLIVGGGIANTFIAAEGHEVGRSLCEDDLLDEARSLMAQAKAEGRAIPVPTDVVVGREFSATTPAKTLAVDAVSADDMIFDIGPDTAKAYDAILAKAGTIIWNGPVGVFEFEAFSGGTQALAESIAKAEGFSLAGGGDTLAAIDQFHVANNMSYISTGGGAFLEFIEGKTLPAVAMLEQRAAQ